MMSCLSITSASLFGTYRANLSENAYTSESELMGQPQEYMATNLEDWARSDRYHNVRLIGSPDPSLVHALQTSNASGLPEIAVSEAQGKFINLLAKSIQATRILEVGTLGGYSTIWLARALPPNGKLTSLEVSEKHAVVARENIAHAGLEEQVQILVGPAMQTLPMLQPEPPFDFAFIDADKSGNLDYFKQAKRLVRPGGVILVDNVVRYGRVADLNLSDDKIEGVRRLLEYIKDDSSVEATTLSTVGEKGYDGFLYALRL